MFQMILLAMVVTGFLVVLFLGMAVHGGVFGLVFGIPFGLYALYLHIKTWRIYLWNVQEMK